MKCEYCGRNNQPNDTLCTGCGASLPFVPEKNYSTTINNTTINTTVINNITDTNNPPTQASPLISPPAPSITEDPVDTSSPLSKEKKIFIATVIFGLLLYCAGQVRSPLYVYITYLIVYALYLCYQILVNKNA